ncbi:MAG: hypothetical protein ACE361_19610 [Aureliella sp.]
MSETEFNFLVRTRAVISASIAYAFGTEGRRKQTLKLLRSALIWGVVVVFIGLGLQQLFEKLDATPHVASAAGALAGALAVVYRVLCGVGWSFSLDIFGAKYDRELMTRIWLISESRRWLPGGVWGYASRASMAEGVGVPMTVGATSMFLELLILLAAAAIVSVPGLLLHWGLVAGSVMEMASKFALHWWIAGGLVGIAAAGVCYPLFKKKAAGFLNRFSSLRSAKLDRPALVKAFLFISSISVLNGLVTGCLIKSIPDAPQVPIEMVVAATSIAWVVGLFALFSPGGLIVREGVLAAILIPWLPYSTGFTVALLARLVQIFAELTCMVWVALAARTKRVRDVSDEDDLSAMRHLARATEAAKAKLLQKSNELASTHQPKVAEGLSALGCGVSCYLLHQHLHHPRCSPGTKRPVRIRDRSRNRLGGH